MIPKILHQCKASPHKYYTWEERRLAKVAQALMPEWKYNAWMDEDNIALVSQIFPRYVQNYLDFPNGGSKTDVARYLYMYQYGGIYFDTDYRFFKSINKTLLSSCCILAVELEDFRAFPGLEYPLLGNAFIGSRPGLALWTELVDSIFTRFRKGDIPPDAVHWSGPLALTEFLRMRKQYEQLVTILPSKVVYPRRIRFNLTGARNGDTIGVHLCWSSWRNMSLPHKVKNRTRRILSALA